MHTDPRHINEPAPWPPRDPPVDLKTFVMNLASDGARRGRETLGQTRRVFRFVELEPVEIRSAPLMATGLLDGVQARCLTGRVCHRDVSAVWISAGIVQGDQLMHVEERLAIVCAALDEARVRAAGPGVPVVALHALLPWDVATQTAEWIDATRRALELRALEAAPNMPGGHVVVDGPLPAAASRTDAVGVVKSAAASDFLSGPSPLPDRGGWRSPAMLLPATQPGERSRLSAFVRLRDADATSAWDYSLVRVEVWEEAGILGRR